MRGYGPDNVLKGQWPVLDSPLSVTLAGASGPARLAPRTPLVAAQTLFSTTRMQRDFALLASESLQGRGAGTPGLDQAADYIATRFKAAGLQPGAAGTPAAQAGLEAGDVILELNEAQVNNLRDYARALQQLTPDNELRIRYRRNGAEARATARVVAR